MRRYQRCSCMNNQAWNTSTNMIEDKCNNDCSTNCSYEQRRSLNVHKNPSKTRLEK